MKRTVKAVKKVNKIAVIMITAFVLTGCTSGEVTPEDGGVNLATIPGMQKVETQEKTEEAEEPETVVQESAMPTESTMQAESTMQEEVAVKEAAQGEFDVQEMLDETEAQEAALWKKYEEISFPSQTDMNDVSYEMYKVWDDSLNELWQILKETLDEKTMDELLQEQRSWIKEKESAVQQLAEEMGGGSITPVVCNSEAMDRTKERVYELAAYLGYVDGSAGDSGITDKAPAENSRTLTVYIEGMEEKVPATLFEGRLYTLYIPDDGWEMYATEAWRSEVNPAVQFWVTDYDGTDADIVCEQLANAAGYKATEDDKYLLRYEDKDATVWNVKLFTENGETIGIFYCYPAEAEEGFGARLGAIVNTFTWKHEQD